MGTQGKKGHGPSYVYKSPQQANRIWDQVLEAATDFNSLYVQAQAWGRIPEDRLLGELRGRSKQLLDKEFFTEAAHPLNFNHPLGQWVYRNFGPTAFKPELRQNVRESVVLLQNEVARPGTLGGDIPLTRFVTNLLDSLDRYAAHINRLLGSAGPHHFKYQGFQILNPDRMPDRILKQLLSGVDFVVALFKRRGATPVLQETLLTILLRHQSDGETAHGRYYSGRKEIEMMSVAAGLVNVRMLLEWVSEVFLHEVGHHIHLSLMHPEAKEIWDSGWAPVEEARKLDEASAKKIKEVSFQDRERFWNLLVKFKGVLQTIPLKGLDRMKFHAWLRNPTVNDPLVTEKQLRWSKPYGVLFAEFFQDPEGYVTQTRGEVPNTERFDRVMARLWDLYKGRLAVGSGWESTSYPILTDEQVAEYKTDSAVAQAISALEVPTDYAKTNEKEDFAESFVAFMSAPERLSTLGRYRMQQALSLSGLYGKQIMRLAKHPTLTLEDIQTWGFSGPLTLRKTAARPVMLETDGLKINYDVRTTSTAVGISVYAGRTRIGGMVAHAREYPERLASCGADVRNLLEKYPQIEDTTQPRFVLWGEETTNVRALMVDKAYITDETKQGMGIGKRMYIAAMREWFRIGGPFLFVPSACESSGSTSRMAKRVWASLTQSFPSSGTTIAVLQMPQMPPQTKAAAKSRYKEKKEVPKADGKGTTTVYVYSEGQVQHRNREKAQRVEKLRGSIEKLRSAVSKDLKSDDEKTRLIALAVALTDHTYERVGNDESAKEGHFGVTGWKKEHISFKDGKATIKYVGKSGVKQNKTVTDKTLVSALEDACEGEGDCVTGSLSASDVNQYLKDHDITAKDIRGYHANTEVQTRLKAIRAKGGDLPKDPKEKTEKLKKEFQQALEETAELVGHKATTLKSQYLVPGLERNYVERGGKVVDNLAKQSTLKVASDISQAVHSIHGEPGVRIRIPGLGWLWTEPHDSEDSFSAIIASYEVVEGWVVYKGRNGSEGVVVGTKAQLEKWAEDIQSSAKPATSVPWDEAVHGGGNLVREATQSAQAVLRALGVSAEIQFWVRGNGGPEGAAAGNLISLWNVHKPVSPVRFINGISLPAHMKVAAHEAAHLGFHKGGRAVVEALKAHGGEYMSAYHALAGHFEGAMEAAALYALAPRKFAGAAPEVFAATQRWFKGKRVGSLIHQSTKTKAEKEDAEAARMSRPAPTKKPPRKDLRRNKMQVPDSPVEDLGAEGDKDLSLNYKRVARMYFASVLQGLGDRKLLSLVAAKRDVDDDHKGPGDYWEGKNGWRAWPKGNIGSTSADSEEHAQSLAEGGGVEDEDFPWPKEPTPQEEDEGEEDRPDPKEQARKQRAKARAKFERGAQKFDQSVKSILDNLSDEMADLLMGAFPDADSPDYEEMVQAFAHHIGVLKDSFIHDDRGVTAAAVKDAAEVLSMFQPSKIQGGLGGGSSKPSEWRTLETENRAKLKGILQGDALGKGILLARLAFAQNVVVNPSLVGGRALTGLQDPGDLKNRTKESARQFRKATPQMRAEAAKRAAEQLEAMAEDDPNRAELGAIIDGLAVAAGVAGESLEVGGVPLRPRMSTQHQILMKHLMDNGKEDLLFGKMDDIYGPTGRSALSKALDTMEDKDLSAMGKEGGFPDLAKKLLDSKVPEYQKVWIRALLKRQGIESMSTTQMIVDVVAQDSKSAMDAAKIAKRFDADLESNLDHQAWQETLLIAASEGGDYSDMEQAYLRWRSRYYLEWLKLMGLNPPKDDPEVARHRYVVETGDTSLLDKVIVKQGEKPPKTAQRNHFWR